MIQSRNLCLLAAAWITLSAPLVAQTTAKTSSFEVVSIKTIAPSTPMQAALSKGYVGVLMDQPASVDAEYVTLAMFIRSAYGYTRFALEQQIAGIPDWAKSQHYDLEAKLSEADVAALKSVPREEQQQFKQRLLQAMLAERFNLKVHPGTTQVASLDLVPAKGGTKLTPAKDDDPPILKTRSGTPVPGSRIDVGKGDLSTLFQLQTMTQFAAFLSSQAPELGKPVMDKTGLPGKYTFTLDHWSPMISMKLMRNMVAADDDTAIPISTALQQQLGMRLQPATNTVDVLIIDHVDPPSPN